MRTNLNLDKRLILEDSAKYYVSKFAGFNDSKRIAYVNAILRNTNYVDLDSLKLNPNYYSQRLAKAKDSLQKLNLRLREDEAKCTNRIRSSNDGGKTWHETHWLFRPIHLNYDLPSDGV